MVCTITEDDKARVVRVKDCEFELCSVIKRSRASSDQRKRNIQLYYVSTLNTNFLFLKYRYVNFEENLFTFDHFCFY